MSVPARIDPQSPASTPLDWTIQSDGSNDPTGEMAAALTRAYGFYNTHLFADRLPPCLITLQRRAGTYGYFAAGRFARTSQTNGMTIADEIAINPEPIGWRSVAETLSTLVHEMVHLAQQHFGTPGRGRYHNQEWARWMKAVGLHPSHSGAPGGKETGDSVSHYITEGGPFDLATAALLADGFTIPWSDAAQPGSGGGAAGGDGASKGKSGKRTKFICPIAGCDEAVWGKARSFVLCGHHNVKLEPEKAASASSSSAETMSLEDV